MPVTFEKTRLKNGLTVIAEVDPAAHTAACGFFVKAGARDEAGEVMGVSHFLEHMMFKGTARRSADDVNREFDEIGASYNAYTTSEMTCFYATVLPEFLPSAADILADILRPALRTSDFDSEKKVILEEIAMYKDNPFWVLYEHAMEKHYGSHPMSHRVLGLETTIGALLRDQMDAYFRDRYSADNTVVALAGKLDFDKSVKQIESLCGAWQTTRASRDNAAPRAGGGSFTKVDEKVSRAYTILLAPAPSVQDERRYAAMMLSRLLGDEGNSRLHWALVEPGLAEEAQASYEAHDGAGDFFVFTSCPPERADEVWAVAEREIARLPEGLTDADLELQRNKLATSVTLAGERPGGRMQRLGRMWLYLGEHKTLEEELDAINAVTVDDVRSLYVAFPFQPRTVGRLTPKA